MKTFLKAQTASLIATITDFFVTIVFVEFLHAPIVAAGVSGNIVGAFVSFLISRTWVFDSQSQNVAGQAIRYALVWCGYLALNACGMYLMEHFTALHYVIYKAIVGLTLAVTYNYILQKRFVFN